MARVFYGTLQFHFDEVPVAVDGKPAWADGSVWVEYRQEEGRDDGRAWAETDYSFEKGSLAIGVFNDDGLEIPVTPAIETQVLQYLANNHDATLLEKIENDCHAFL